MRRRAATRVVISGMGIVSCLGNRLDAVSNALREGRCGITPIDAWRQRGFASQVAGVASVSNAPAFDRKYERFMGDTARFACHAARDALDDAQLGADALANVGREARADPFADAHRLASTLGNANAGAIIGSGVGSMLSYDRALAIANARGVEKTPPYTVTHAMSSTASANVAQVFGLPGPSYSPSSACTTSALAIGQAFQLIQSGRHQIMLAGGSEALHDNMTLMFDAMGALSHGANDYPAYASRPYDTSRNGFVIASGAGVLVLEALEHALARKAPIYAELTAFAQCTDPTSMVSPRAAGIARVMRLSQDEAGHAPDYINVHAPSTQHGDLAELAALRLAFGDAVPDFSSTKGLSGHPLGACGVHEAIYTVLMMRDNFKAGTGAIRHEEPILGEFPLIRCTQSARIAHAMSVSFGFGGSCASLMFSKWSGV